jgi:hypothetical protein
MSTVTDNISSAFQELVDVFEAAEYADLCAIGVWTDNPSNPGVTAIVFQGKLYALTVPDSYTSLDPVVLTDIINAVILNAFIEWDADRQRLLAQTSPNGDA